jgi:predicted alpha/beta-hydrolase family hydrolase
MRRHVEGLRARGITAEAIDLPRGRAERAAYVFEALIGPGVVIGGHSFGGRAASLAAAAAASGARPAGLIAFGFPLSAHAGLRTAHFPRIACPALIVNGDRDELSPIDVLRERAALLPRGRLVVLPGAGHQLDDRQLDAALDIAADFVRTLRTR